MNCVLSCDVMFCPSLHWSGTSGWWSPECCHVNRLFSEIDSVVALSVQLSCKMGVILVWRVALPLVCKCNGTGLSHQLYQIECCLMHISHAYGLIRKEFTLVTLTTSTRNASSWADSWLMTMPNLYRLIQILLLALFLCLLHSHTHTQVEQSMLRMPCQWPHDRYPARKTESDSILRWGWLDHQGVKRCVIAKFMSCSWRDRKICELYKAVSGSLNWLSIGCWRD